MNAKLSTIAIALIATSAAAFAADDTAPARTRAEVRAELEQAQARGTLAQNSEFVEFTHIPSTKTRAQVRAELERSPATATAQTEYVEPPRVASGKSRAEVREELEQAYAQGQLEHQEFVEFTNVASTRSRDDVRAEAIRAAKETRQRGDSSGS